MQKDIIGFWGYVPKNMIEENKRKYPNVTFVDLDIGFDYPNSNILPESYCKILRNIMDNSFYLQNRLIKILAPIGKDKCDGAFFLAQILKDKGFDVEEFSYDVCHTKNEKLNLNICESNLPLRKKVELITASITDDINIEATPCKPKFGFWGVPPHDLSILELFPNETHVFGWLRCVEAMFPSDIELEMSVNPDIPTVFFCQTFCAKNQLAKYLANKYQGLYIDIDGTPTNSARAKIEAFLRLR